MEKQEILEKIESGELGYHIWSSIIPYNKELFEKYSKRKFKYFIPVPEECIKKGYLKIRDVYKIIFRFAEHECPYYEKNEEI